MPVQDAPPREGPAVQVFGRLADGASWQDAAAELDVVSARFADDQPTTHAQLRTRVRAFAGRTPGDPLRLEDLAVHAIVLLLGAVSANVVVALVFSAAGLYALMAVAVARRTREIGIRLALGANPRHVLGSVFARAGRQLGGGIIAGNGLILLIAWRADAVTADLLVLLVIMSVIMAAVGVLACAAPARRALRIQPTEALRQS